MHNLLKKEEKYVDAEKMERVTKNLQEWWEPKTHKQKLHDEQKATDRN